MVLLDTSSQGPSTSLSEGSLPYSPIWNNPKVVLGGADIQLNISLSVGNGWSFVRNLYFHR